MTTLERLQAKAEMKGSIRMPFIDDIHKLLNENKIEHYYGEVKSKNGTRYVNEKDGKKIVITLSNDEREFVGCRVIEMNTSESSYSLNADMYARQIIKLLTFKNKNK